LPATRRLMIEALIDPKCVDPRSTTEIAEATAYPTGTARRYLQELAAHRLVDRLPSGPGKADRWQRSATLTTLLQAVMAPVTATLSSCAREDAIHPRTEPEGVPVKQEREREIERKMKSFTLSSLPSLLRLAIERYCLMPYTAGTVPPPDQEDHTDAEFLAEAYRVFDAEVVGALPRDDAERRWAKRLRPLEYSYPWPDMLPGLGPHAVGPYTPCQDCQEDPWLDDWLPLIQNRVPHPTGTWSVYGGKPLCLVHAYRRATR
jgi:hypothetical protein